MDKSWGWNMPKQKKVTKRTGLEEQYAEMFKVLVVRLRGLPLPESLEQPSPLQIVPMISADSVNENDVLVEGRQVGERGGLNMTSELVFGVGIAALILVALIMLAAWFNDPDPNSWRQK